MSTHPIEVRAEPRVTVTKLAEYLVATAVRRKSIIQDQREPSAFKVARYTDAERAITEYITAGFDESILDRAAARLALHEPRSEFDEQRVQLCREALRLIRGIPLADELEGATVRAATSSPHTLSFGRVTVSVRPELVLKFVDGKNRERRGAIKLCFSKTHPLNKDSGEYVGAIVHQHALLGPDGEAVDHRRVLAVDVFAQRIFTAPKAIKTRLKDVAAACEEISIRWDSA